MRAHHLEIRVQDEGLVVRRQQLLRVGELRGVDDGRAERPDHVERRVERRDDVLVAGHEQPRDAQAHPAQRVAPQRRRVVRHPRGLREREVIERVAPRDDAQDRGRVRDGARDGAHRVLVHRDRHHLAVSRRRRSAPASCAAQTESGAGLTSRARRQADGGLDPDEVVPAARRHDAPVRLAPERGGREADRAADRAARARAGRVRLREVRARRLPAAPGPPGGEVPAEVRPLGQVRLAEEDRARRAQLRGDGGVARRDGAEEGEGACGRVHACEDGRVNIIPCASVRSPARRDCLPSLAWVAMLSFSRIGMPCSGPRAPVAWRSLSSAAAWTSALGFVSITARSAGP